MPVRPEIQKVWDEALSGTKGEKFISAGRTEEREPIGGETLLGNIIDVLSRGEYASALASKDYIMGKKFDIGRYKNEFLEAKEKITYDELVDKTFPDLPKWPRKALGLALSISFDPTTYIPAGLIAKGITKTGQVIKKGVIATKIGKKVAKDLEDSFINKAFRPSAGLPKDYYELKYDFQKKLSAEHEYIKKDAEYLRSGLSKDEMDLLSYYREHPNEAVPDHLKVRLGEIKQKFDDLIDKGVNDGILLPEVAEKWRGKEIPYVPHYYPEQGYKLVSGLIPPDLFGKIKKPSYLKKRTFETLEDAKAVANDFMMVSQVTTLKEAKTLISKLGLEDAFGKLDLKDMPNLKSYAEMLAKHYTPDENIIRAYARRAYEQANFTIRENFIDSVLTNPQFSQKVKAGTKIVPEGHGIYLPKGAIRFYGKDVISDDILNKLIEKYDDLIPAEELVDALKNYPSITKKVPTYMLPKSIAKDMNRTIRGFGDPAIGEFWQLFDKAQNAWKMMATTVRLPFHLRNMYSNWWQAYLSGIHPERLPDRLLDAARFQSKRMKSITLGGKKYSREELEKAVNEMGIHGKGWMGADIPQSFFNELESIVKWGKLRKLNPMQAGRRFGSMIEDNSRIAVFFDQIAKGKSFKEAQQTVRKYLFDYTELTEFEKKVMRRAWPFYTWSRKNIPLQIQSLLQQPRKFQVYEKGLRAYSEPETAEELKYKPEYFNELLYIKSPMKTEKGKPIYMTIDLPPIEFNRMLNIRHWISGMSPVKLFAEIGFNFKTFPEISEIKKYQLDKTRAPFWVAYLPEKALDIMKKNHVIGEIIDRRTKKKIMGIDKKWLHGIQSAFPFLNEINRINAQPIYLDDESPKMKFKSYITGISQSAFDIDVRKENQIYGAYKARKDTRTFVVQHGRMPTKTEMKKLDPNEIFSGMYGNQ